MYIICIDPKADCRCLNFPEEFDLLEGGKTSAVHHFNFNNSPYIEDMFGKDTILLTRKEQLLVLNEFGTSVVNQNSDGLFNQQVFGNIYLLKNGDYNIPIGFSQTEVDKIMDWLDIRLVFYRNIPEVSL